MGKGVLGPCELHHVEILAEPISRFFVRQVVALIGTGEPASANPQIEPTLADVVQRRNLLSHADGVSQRQNQYAGANSNALGALCDGGCENHGSRDDGRHPSCACWRGEVTLSEPNAVESQIFSHMSHLERFVEGLPLVQVWRIVALHRKPYMHHDAPSGSHCSELFLMLYQQLSKLSCMARYT